jgi:cytoskeletal protein CcmA (bactofilin family)
LASKAWPKQGANRSVTSADICFIFGLIDCFRSGCVMFFNKKSKNQPVRPAPAEPCFISRDTTLEGNLICDGEIHIDGAVRGNIRAQTCLIEVHGEVIGEIVAENIFVRGKIIGPINGRHVHVFAGAHVEGNVTNETISIENGSFVLGNIRRAEHKTDDLIGSPLDNVLPIKGNKLRG